MIAVTPPLKTALLMLRNDDATITVDRIVYTTTGELTASGEVDNIGGASFSYDGRLAVIENNKLVDTVTIKSDGVGGFFPLTANARSWVP